MKIDLQEQDMVAALGLDPGSLLQGLVSAQAKGGREWEPPPLEELQGTVDGLDFLRLVDRGAMGAVFLARQVNLERQVAVKLLPPEWLHSDVRAQQFAREGRLLASLRHPNVVMVYNRGETSDGWPFLEMEYVEGGTLAALLRKGVVPRAEACRLMAEIVEGVAAAHALEISHRDLKPSNILLDSRHCAKVADFGLSALRDEGGGGERVGTRRYSAPEQLLGGETHGLRADVYSLGVLACELLTGRLPGDESYGTALPGTGVPEPFGGVVRRALSPDPARRQADAAVFLEEWQAAVNAEANRRKLRKTRRIAVAFAALLVAVAVAGGLAWQNAAEARAARASARITAATSDVVSAQEALERSGPDAAMPWLARALRLDPENESAGWLALQLLTDRRPLQRVASVPTEWKEGFISNDRIWTISGGAFLIQEPEGVLMRCQVLDAESSLQVSPWPKADAPLKGCLDIALCEAGNLLVAVLSDGSLQAFELQDGTPLWQVPALAEYPAHTLRVSGSGNLVVQSAVMRPQGQDPRSGVRVVSAADGAAIGELLTFPHEISAHSLAVTYDDTWLVTGTGYAVWLACTNLKTGETRDLTDVWNVTGRNSGAVFALCPLPASTLMLVGGQCRGSRVMCMDVATGERLWDVPVLGAPRDYTMAVYRLLLAPGGQRFAVAGSESSVMMHDTKDGRSAGPLLRGESGNPLLYFTGDDQLVVSAKTSAVWNWRTGERIVATTADNVVPCGAGQLLRLNARVLELWKTGESQVRIADFRQGTEKACFDLDASRSRLLAGAGRGAVQVVNLQTLQPESPPVAHALPGGSVVRRFNARPRMSGDGTALLTWDAPDTVSVHFLREGPAAQPLKLQRPQPVICAALSPHGRVAALGLADGTWEAHDLTGQTPSRVSAALRTPVERDGAYGAPGRAVCMEFSPDGGRLAIGTELWCTVSIWNTGDWQVVQPPSSCDHVVSDLCFDSDANGSLWSADYRGDCQHFERPPYINRLPPRIGLDAPVLDCAISPDRRWLAAASLDHTARIYTAGTLQFMPPALEHAGGVTAVDWSPDGRRLLTATATGEVNVWDRITGRRIFSWPQGTTGVVQAAFALNGSRIAIARMDGLVRVREVYAGGQVPAETPRLLEELSGYRVGDDGQLVVVGSGPG